MRPHTIYLFAAVACLSGAGCADEVNVFEGRVEQASLLIGSWEWPVEVSRLEVDSELRATQTSDFDNPGAAPSSYTMTPLNDGTLVLEGWLANAPCEPDVVCDEGRAYQRYHMSYHVDDEHFMPFALLRKSGSPAMTGGAGAGVFEGFGVEETRLSSPGADGEEVFRGVEIRWRLSLDAGGAWRSTKQRMDLDSDAALSDSTTTGTWTLARDGRLSLRDADGRLTQTLWEGDVIALDGLVFNRDP